MFSSVQFPQYGLKRGDGSLASKSTEPFASLNEKIGFFLDSQSIDYNELQGTIVQCRNEAMRGSIEHQIALEILVPLSMDRLPVKHSQIKNEAKAFFEGWLNPYGAVSDVGKKASLIEKVFESAVRSELGQSVAEDLVNNVTDFFTTGPEPSVAHAALRNTCYFDAALNILLKNPSLNRVVHDAQPRSEDWQEIQALLVNLGRSFQIQDGSSDYVRLHQKLSSQLVPQAGQSAQESQQDANELIGLVLQGLGVDTGLLNAGVLLEELDNSEPDPLVYVEQSRINANSLVASVRPNGVDHSLVGVNIHSGAKVSSENGVSSNFGHYYSLVKNESNQWDLYSYTQKRRSFPQQSIENVIEQLSQDATFSGANYSGIYAKN